MNGQVTREQARDMAEAHAEGLHAELPREFCPECEGRELRDYPPLAASLAPALPDGLDREPYFSAEAQEVFTADSRVFAVTQTGAVKQGGEGVYLGRSGYGAFVGWDTPSGKPYTESVPFSSIRNLYR